MLEWLHDDETNEGSRLTNKCQPQFDGFTSLFRAHIRLIGEDVAGQSAPQIRSRCSKFKIQKAKDFREFRSKIINEKSEKYKL